MSVELYYSTNRTGAVMVCTTSDCAFGPVLDEPDKNHAEKFIEENYHKLRAMGTTNSDLFDMWYDWCETTRCPECGTAICLIEVESMTATGGCICPDDIGFTTDLAEGCPDCGEPVE